MLKIKAMLPTYENKKVLSVLENGVVFGIKSVAFKKQYLLRCIVLEHIVILKVITCIS